MDRNNIIEQVDLGVLNEYAGISIEKGQLIGDVLFGLLLVLFFCFAIIYQQNVKQVVRTFRNLLSVKERQSMFAFSTGGVALFRSFMIFQLLTLSSVSLFCIVRILGGVDFNVSEIQQLIILLVIFGTLFSYYQLKQLLYFAIGRLFFEEYHYQLWKNGYNSVQIILGVLLYIPALWLVFVSKQHEIALFLLVFLYISSRLVIFYKVIRIFSKKGYDILYLILYLCAQEILPLVFLYEGLVYLYNFIETSTLWH